jgi:hypothetical protein
MPYALIDDQAYDHPKFNACSDAAAGVWFKALGWCARHLTDGRIDRATIHRISTGGRKAVDTCIAELVTVGLFDEVPHDAAKEAPRKPRGRLEEFQFHDYSHHNPSAAQQRRKRAEVSEARAEAGRRGAAARWGDGKPDGKPIANRSQDDGKHMTPSSTSTKPTNSELSLTSYAMPVANETEPVDICPTCDCLTDRPGSYIANGLDVICTHDTPSAEAFLA